MNYTLKNERIEAYNQSDKYVFPKYTSQLINWANQNAQGTRPRVVGQMSELFPEFMNCAKRISIDTGRSFILSSILLLLKRLPIRSTHKLRTSVKQLS